MNGAPVADHEAIRLAAFLDPCTTEQHGFDSPAHAYIWGMDEADDVLPALLAQKAVIILR